MKKINLLLVEDNDTDAMMALRIFKKETNHHTYKWLPDGEEVLNYFKNLEAYELPDFVLLDLKIPKVSGMDVLKYLKTNETTAKIPVIVYTSSGQKSDMNDAYTYGANSFLTKPNDYVKMKEVLGTTYRYWLEYNKK